MLPPDSAFRNPPRAGYDAGSSRTFQTETPPMLRSVETSLLPRQIDVLRDLEPEVADLIRVHDAKRRLWWPTDLLGIQESDDPEKYLKDLRARAAGIPDAVRISLV